MINFKKVISILNESEAKNPAELLQKKLAKGLVKIISNAVDKFECGPSWNFESRNKEELIQHIDDMCNEFNLRVSTSGELVKNK